MNADILVVGAHPDDIEIGIGGAVCKFCRAGYRVVLLDLTRGESGTRGSVEERAREAARAADILGVCVRENAGLPDGGLANIPEQRKVVAEYIRKYTPRIILAPMNQDRHPDHNAAHELVRDANHLAGVGGLESEYPRFRSKWVYYYRVYVDADTPHLVIDISNEFETKMEALRAYQSQFYNPNYVGQTTYISTPEFWEAIRARAVLLGARIQAKYAEGIFVGEPVAVTLLPGLEKPK
ncbi:MAG TPA: bacillithiol biosynthesis deacetylase BshB1 [Candidatus Hydrogenedentes bacterium]|nr:bacillithiol biosynthesis deacetylase BshB1 [Candidatus Hydrogenedentota bacterium]HOL77522.1 bacillithiol biosynthesis deacetylase BshB1 [Candidatus Hydrogenedentota bacterium]HPO86599.1 bacillithiol biosynthesis deacetylase BshB1 [Candidatus Hydrogenedentota bacterium]